MLGNRPETWHGMGYPLGIEDQNNNNMRFFAAFTSVPGNMNSFKPEKRRSYPLYRQEWLTMAKAHRSSLKEKLQEEFLSCKICLEPYLRPKALPCLHSFCEHCLRDYVRRHPGQRPGHFPCPMCRKDIQIPDGGITNFQDNFVLLSLSDTLEEDDVWQDPNLHQLSPPRTLAPPTPLEQKLKNYEWYFGKVSRNASEEWLLSTGYPKGSFLIRQGEASPDTLTLSVRDCDELRGYLVKHYKIFSKKDDYPGTMSHFITPKRMFKSLQELVEHYTESADGLCCKLSQVCGKPRSLTWAMERGKEDEYSIARDVVNLVKRVGSGQFADVWLGENGCGALKTENVYNLIAHIMGKLAI